MTGGAYVLHFSSNNNNCKHLLIMSQTVYGVILCWITDKETEAPAVKWQSFN